MNKLYPALVRTVVQNLIEIFENNRYADKVVQYALKNNPKAGSKDRAFIAQTTYDMVRWWRLLWFLVDKDIKVSEKNLYTLFGIYWQWKGNSLPEWKEFFEIPTINWKARLEESKKFPPIFHSIPDWMYEAMVKELGAEKTASELYYLNKEASVYLRTNLLKITQTDLVKQLAKEGLEVEKVSDHPAAIHLKKRFNVFQLPQFKEGLFEMQDLGSQFIAPYLEVEPGMRVVDACAGAGGKSLHLASMMNNKGRLITMDIEAWKLDELKKRSKRAGISIIETRVIESSKTIKRQAESCDRLLLDVPCSGLGVIKRNPDSKWKLQAEFLDNIRKTQAEIIQSYSRMLKPGGMMVYATCSILPSENEDQVNLFLKNNPNYSLIKQQQIMPSENNTDGFYMALIKKELQ